MSKPELSAREEWADNPLQDLPLDAHEQRANGRLQGWIARREFLYAEAPVSRVPVLVRIAAAAALLIIVVAFAAFNLQNLASRRPSSVATPSSAPTAVPTATAPASPLPTSKVATPGVDNPPASGSWQTLAALPAPKAHFTATLMANGKVLIVGGVSDATVAGSASSDVYIYDPVTKTITRTGSLSIGRAGQTATLLRDGRVLVVGGYTQPGSQSLSSVEIYDPSTGRWTGGAPLHQGRSEQAAVVLADGRVMVIGGSSYPPVGISPHGSAPATLAPEIYDPAHDTWTVAATQVYDRPVEPTATLLKSGKVLVVGGQYMWNSPDEASERSELYDVGSNKWTGVAPDPRFEARQFQSATMLPDGKVLVAGGMIDLQPTGTAALYDPSSNSWIELPTMTQPRCGQGAVLLATGRVLLAGSGCWSALSATVEEFDPLTSRFYAVASLRDARGSGIAVGLLDGTVLSAGGIDGGGASSDVEVFKAS